MKGLKEEKALFIISSLRLHSTLDCEKLGTVCRSTLSSPFTQTSFRFRILFLNVFLVPAKSKFLSSRYRLFSMRCLPFFKLWLFFSWKSINDRVSDTYIFKKSQIRSVPIFLSIGVTPYDQVTDLTFFYLILARTNSRRNFHKVESDR